MEGGATKGRAGLVMKLHPSLILVEASALPLEGRRRARRRRRLRHPDEDGDDVFDALDGSTEHRPRSLPSEKEEEVTSQSNSVEGDIPDPCTIIRRVEEYSWSGYY